MKDADIKLTEYSHGAGCGCKISSKVLDTILASELSFDADPNLLVGNGTRDDAAAYNAGNGQLILSTTDFFMPIVDDPFDFGRIAATNAISDVYAMGGKPMMAIAILGWPINSLSAEVAQKVIDGGRQACSDADIMLAGGHSIDSPEPIFGLAVTGQVEKKHLKQNSTATADCLLYLTKPLGVGVLTTAQKQKKLLPEHRLLARDVMCQLNSIGTEAAKIDAVKAITDVTGFGLAGHLLEICEGSGVNAILNYDDIICLDSIKEYISQGCVPGGTARNFESYGHQLGELSDEQRNVLCDPQTSGGLLIAVEPEGQQTLEQLFSSMDLNLSPFGSLVSEEVGVRVEIT